MQIGDKIHPALVFLMILGIMVFTFAIMLSSNNAFSQTVHDKTLYEVVKQSSGLEDIGNFPVAIITEREKDVIYLLNSGSDTVSVLSARNYTKIVDDIPVGRDPTDIESGSGSLDRMIFVANAFSNTVSVLSARNYTKIVDDIPVGVAPTTIYFDYPDRIYVANRDSDTISVISTENYATIPVGRDPTDIEFNLYTNAIVVANSDSDGISVIDDIANRVVEGVTFQVEPFNSGYIVCNDLTTPSPDDLTRPSPIGEYIYVYSGAECIAKPNDGFEFVSWEENLRGIATRLISISRPASQLDFFSEFLHIKSPDKPEAKLHITKFGTFTANFKELPPAVPSEYWIPLYGIIVSTIVGWSIPSIISWARSKADVRKLNYYHNQITSLYGDGKLDEDDIEPLNRLRINIVDAYSKGKVNEKHYESLRNEISILYEKIFRKRIDDALTNNKSSNSKATQKQLAQIRNDVKYAYSEGKLNEKHYNLLSKDILDLESK